MASGLPVVPATLASGNVVGRLALGTGPAEAIPFASLAAALFGTPTIYAGTVVGTNTVTAITISPIPALALVAGQVVYFVPTATNTGAVTFNRDALGAKSVLQNGLVLIGGELKINIPAVLFYDGTQYNLVGQVFTQYLKRKTADQSITSSTTLTNDNDLLFPIAASEEWVATFSIDAGAALQGNTGIQFAITTPAGATLNAYGVLLGTSAVAVAPTGGRTTTSGSTILNIAAGGGLQNGMAVEIRIWVLNGATPGTVNLQWAQGTSSGTALTFRKGSFMQAVRIA